MVERRHTGMLAVKELRRMTWTTSNLPIFDASILPIVHEYCGNNANP